MQEDQADLESLRASMFHEDAEVAAAEGAGPDAAQADRRARTCLVEDAAEAQRVAQLLMAFARGKADVLNGEPLVFGCDTEVSNWSAVAMVHGCCQSILSRVPS